MFNDTVLNALRKRGYTVSHFATAAEAAAHIVTETAGLSVGIGGSMSVEESGLYEKLKDDGREVYWHLRDFREEVMLRACEAEVYISSVNALSEQGDLVNIDGRGNRLAGSLMKKKKLIFLVGANKLCPDLSAALDRAHNVAAPKNAARLERKTPCAVTGHCHDCASPDRICSATLILSRRPGWCEDLELVLVDEELGY